MTGLLAIISGSPGSSPVREAELDQLVKTYEAVRQSTGCCKTPAGSRAAACLMRSAAATSLEVATQESSWAVVAGVVHGPADPVRARLEDVDGQFARVAYDAERDEVTVASDPFGMQAVYVADQGDRTYVSTSALVLAKHLRAAADPLALFSFLRAGYHFGTMTHWHGVRRLDPGTCLRFDSSGCQATSYFRPAIDPGVARLSFGRAVDHCIEVGVDTCRRFLGGERRWWLDLTAGYDSRLLALLARKAAVSFDTDTRGPDGSDDVRTARSIVALTGWNWSQYSLPESWARTLPTMIGPALAWGDGHLEVIELAWVLWAHREASKRIPALLIGGGGEHYRAFAWPQEFMRGGKSTRVNFDNWINMRLLHPMDTSVFARDPTAEVADDSRRRMSAWAAPYNGELNTTQLDVLYAYKMTGHFGAYRSADSAYMWAELPFYFRPMFEVAFSTNYEFRNHHRLMRHMIERLDPKISAVRTSAGGPAQGWRPRNVHRFLPYYGRLARRATTKLSQVALGRAVLDPGPSEMMRAFGATTGSLLAESRDALPLRPAEMHSSALYKRARLTELLEAARANALADTTLLGRILTVELALRESGASIDA